MPIPATRLPILAALAVLAAWSTQPPIVGGLTDLRHERPNLGISDDTLAHSAMISLRRIGIRNVGHVSGEGFLSIAVIDSVGRALTEVMLEDGKPIGVPSASLGGMEGRIITISGPPAFRKLLDSLVRTESRFGLRARIRTVGGDADESDNVRTREWGPWVALTPSATVALTFSFAVPEETRTAELHIQFIGVPIGAHLVNVQDGHRLFLHPGHYAKEVLLRTPKQLPHGSVFVARLTLTDSITGKTLQQHERFAAYDTVPPMLSNYRAVLLRDGRVAIQVQAGDHHSGISESGVATRFSLDGGKTWSQQVHSSVEDDFGRPALFETVIGPVAPGLDLLIGLRAEDMVGNTTASLPIDASVFLAPNNAEQALSILPASRIDGHPIFKPASIARLTAWIDTANSKLLTGQSLADLSTTPADQFEVRRLQELREIPQAFRRWEIDLSRFELVDAPFVKLMSDRGVDWSVLHVPAWR